MEEIASLEGSSPSFGMIQSNQLPSVPPHINKKSKMNQRWPIRSVLILAPSAISRRKKRKKLKKRKKSKSRESRKRDKKRESKGERKKRRNLSHILSHRLQSNTQTSLISAK